MVALADLLDMDGHEREKLSFRSMRGHPGDPSLRASDCSTMKSVTYFNPQRRTESGNESALIPNLVRGYVKVIGRELILKYFPPSKPLDSVFFRQVKFPLNASLKCEESRLQIHHFRTIAGLRNNQSRLRR